MGETDIRQTTTSSLNSGQSDYSVDPQSLENASDHGETSYYNTNWTKYLGYYKTIPELKQAIDALAMWTAGKGWVAENNSTKVLLDRITGWGEDTFSSIMDNMIRVKKINGDAYAEIVRNKSGVLINLKPLDPSNIKVIVGSNGIIKRYEELSSGKKFKPSKVLHLVNTRVANEIHGISVIEACEEIILARNEAITDWRKVLHRNINPLKIFQVDTDNKKKIDILKSEYTNMTKDYEALFVPKGNLEVDIPNVPLQNPTEWIRYLENFFYQAVGTPKIILGGSQEFTEASSKVGYLTFEQVYATEQRELEGDLWNQLAIRVTFERPVSLKENVQGDEEANTGQTNFQPNELNPNTQE